jgi:polyisoprenyl-teichoic acid--peptidoglycan teichoic acid transferase
MTWRKGCSVLLCALGLLAGCGPAKVALTPAPSATASPTPSTTPLPPSTLTPTPTERVFPAPRETAATPIPPAAEPLPLPPGARVLLLAGLDEADPFSGRSDAILLLLYHPRLAKAALISVPPDMFGYLPGWTMQRFSAAYPLGGARLLVDTLDYNLGLRPDDYLIANTDDFVILVDELGGLIVPVLEPFPGVCGEIVYPGDVPMTGAQVLCYTRLRDGMDESARGLRQQQVLRLILDRFLQSGSLSRLPELYPLFRPRLDTSLTAQDVTAAFPLALRLGDPARTAYFQIGVDQTRVWQISERPPAEVFLPRAAPLRKLLEEAVAFISLPSPMSDQVLTLAAELTTTPTVTLTATATLIPTATEIPLFSPTPSETASITPGPSPTASLTPSPTVTETLAP